MCRPIPSAARRWTGPPTDPVATVPARTPRRAQTRDHRRAGAPPADTAQPAAAPSSAAPCSAAPSSAGPSSAGPAVALAPMTPAPTPSPWRRWTPRGTVTGTATPPPHRRDGGSGCSSPPCWSRARWPRWSGCVLLWPSGGPPPTAQTSGQQPVRAEVTATRAADCTPGSGDGGCVAARRADGGRAAAGPRPRAGRARRARYAAVRRRRRRRARLVGRRPDDPGSYQIVDFQRGDAAGSGWRPCSRPRCCVLGRWRGLAALAALVLSFGVLLVFVLPAILAGTIRWPSPSSGSCLIMFVVLYLTHGPSARTSTAVLGTLVSLALIGGAGGRVLGRGPAHRTRRPDQQPHRRRSAPASTPAGCCSPAWSSARSACSTTSPSPRPARCGSCAGPNPALGARRAVRRGDADRARPRRLGGEHAGARLRRRLAAAAAAVHAVRARRSARS